MIDMTSRKESKRSFRLLTAVGIFFALLLCLLTSAMIYVAVPQTVPFITLLFENRDRNDGSKNAMIFVQPSATPFLPSFTQTPADTSFPTEEPADIVKTKESAPTKVAEAITAPSREPEEEIGEIPPSANIAGIYGSPQLYTLDCEVQAAVDWARYFGVDIHEYEFIDRMPLSDDPEEGFVGNINGSMGQFPPDDYGVHAGPVADLLNNFGVPAQAVRGWDLKRVKNEIASGRPVIVWIVNLPFKIDTQEYKASNGRISTVARFEHTWIVTAYNMNVLTIVDSEWTYNVKTSTFMEPSPGSVQRGR